MDGEALVGAVVLFAAITCGLVGLMVVRRGGWRCPKASSMPREIRRAKLWCAERLFVATEPLAVSARVDRAYRAASGQIVLVELKTRQQVRVCLADVIELSVQRVAIIGATGEQVAAHAYCPDKAR